jgi:Zn-dependent protease
MALTAAAGPVSNILLSIVFAGLLRLDLLLITKFFSSDLSNVWNVLYGYAVELSLGFKMMSVLTYMLYMGVLLNISLAVFNLIPIPPFDGSRIAYTFLPVNLYFKIMRYERYIMIGILLLLWFTPFLDGLIGIATGGLASLVMAIFGFSGEGEAITSFNTVIFYVTQALIS